MYNKYFKRVFDFLVSFILLVLLSPLFIIIVILIKIKLGSPVIFKQRRIGLNNKEFILYKFRTMTNKKDDKGELLSDEIRLTKFGKFLRSVSLDELPQLFNILKGDMSFIGPRPLISEYLKLYNEEQIKRHNVRPGLSGFAQVEGRNSLSWNEKFKYDIKYVENISILLDIKIFFKSIVVVLKRSGISSKNNVTMDKFTGNN